MAHPHRYDGEMSQRNESPLRPDPRAELYLSGGGLGSRAHAWPAAIDWLASREGGIALVSLASADMVQARSLHAVLSSCGQRAEVVGDPLRDEPSASTLLLCGGDATLLAGDSERAALLRRWLDDATKTIVADSASAMALGRRAASCTCGGHAIRVIDGLDLLGGFSVLAHASGREDVRLAALGGGPLLALPTASSVRWSGGVPIDASWSKRGAITVRGDR